MLETIRELCAIGGISGDEGAVSNYIQGKLAGVCQMETDKLGNLIVHKTGAKRPQKTIMLSAHMDEVGLIITGVQENGMLRFATVGGIDTPVLLARQVEIGAVRGVIGVKPIHMLSPEERKSHPKTEELSIDIGASSKEEALKLVKIGQAAVFRRSFAQLGQFVSAPALDDRAGCALLMELAKADLPYDVKLVFTVQEEIGGTGAEVAAFRLQPDISIVVETTTAGDIFGTEESRRVCSIGKGPVVSFMDRGTIYDRQLLDIAAEVAVANNIPYQLKEGVYGGNESRRTQTAGAGAQVLAVSLPCRYLHSAASTFCPDDFAPTVQLLRALIERLGE